MNKALEEYARRTADDPRARDSMFHIDWHLQTATPMDGSCPRGCKAHEVNEWVAEKKRELGIEDTEEGSVNDMRTDYAPRVTLGRSGYLAQSPVGFWVQIAVISKTSEADAIDLWHKELREWERLRATSQGNR